MTTPRDVLAYTAKLPRLDGAGGSPALLVPVWTRAGGAAFAASLDQLATALGISSGGAPTTLPAGGTAGQVLRKRSGADHDTEWTTALTLPPGGYPGQVLKKSAFDDGAVVWGVDEVGSGGGGGGNNYFPGGWA